MKNFIKDLRSPLVRVRPLLPFVVIVVLNLIFFGRLFFNNEVFYTPGFGTSDLIHQNIPFRKILVESLKAGKLPLWVSQMGQGFPLFAEGQVGALNIFNLLPSLFLPVGQSLNITYFLTFLLMATSLFLYIRRLGVSPWAALFAATAFTFSAKVVVSVHHLNLLLSLVFFLLNLFIVESFFAKRQKRWLMFLAFSFSQAIFAGHPQILFYSTLFLIGYIGFRFSQGSSADDVETSEVSILKPPRFRNHKDRWLVLVGIFVSFLAGLLISLPQLLPTLDLVRQSNRLNNSLPFEPYPLRLKHFLMFLRPDWFGNARFGTYPINGNQEGFYWENEMYVGLLPLILGVFILVASFWKLLPLSKDLKSQISNLKSTTQNLKLDNNNSANQWLTLERVLLVSFFGSVLLLSLVLSLGKASPLSFIFSLPGFNLFRMPTRFILFADLWLVILAAFGFDYCCHWLKEKLPAKIFFCYLLSVLCYLVLLVDLWSFGFNYNPTVKADELFTPPATAQFLLQDKSQFRITDFGSDVIWNHTFWYQGWEGQESRYNKFLNSLTPNSNLLYNVSSLGSYPGIAPQRSNFVFDIINKNLSLSRDSSVTITDKMLKLFSLTATKYFISPFNLKNENLKFLGQTQFGQGLSNYGIWENTKVLSRVYLVSKIIKAKNTEEAKNLIYQDNFDPSQEIVVEVGSNLSNSSNSTNLESVNPVDYQITNFNDQNEQLALTVNTAKPGYLYLSDSFDSRWRAIVDGIETKIYPANVNGRLIKIEKGEHRVEFKYRLF